MKENPEPIEEVVVKCEVFEISEDERDLIPEEENQNDHSDVSNENVGLFQSKDTQPGELVDSEGVSVVNQNVKKRKKIKKKPELSEYCHCTVCPKSFPTKWQLIKHLRVHSGERPYVCTECGKRYREAHHLKSHEVSHEAIAKNFTCTSCGSAFTRKSSLKTHEKIHTGEKPYQCHICNKSFVQKINLVYHVKVHKGDRKFNCEVCDKKFMTRSKMRQHYNRHLKSFQSTTDLTKPDSNDI